MLQGPHLQRRHHHADGQVLRCRLHKHQGDAGALSAPSPCASPLVQSTALNVSPGARQATFLHLESAVAGEQSAPGQRLEKSEQRKALYGAVSSQCPVQHSLQL